MADEVKLKLVFVNDVNSAAITVAMSTTVSELKTKIQQEHWPATLPALDTVERVRLFAGGREVGGKDSGADAKSLKDAKLAVVAEGTTPVHVHPVIKSGSGTPGAGGNKEAQDTENTANSQCFCTVL
mmetsp:Transcript_47067/g.84811  ORF Transcript_47067/g.84811 Transcript_47067/m.84811 type:complete len:127 (+) Transcript_47067:105-485(+)